MGRPSRGRREIGPTICGLSSRANLTTRFAPRSLHRLPVCVNLAALRIVVAYSLSPPHPPPRFMDSEDAPPPSCLFPGWPSVMDLKLFIAAKHITALQDTDHTPNNTLKFYLPVAYFPLTLPLSATDSTWTTHSFSLPSLVIY